MIVRFRQVENLGRFGGWDSGRSCRDEARLGRLTLIYGRNSAGKSTLTRILTAAASGASLEAERLFGAIGSPHAVIELDAGRLTYDAGRWTGPTLRLRAFDRPYVEANVHVGRRIAKDQRRRLLELALGARDVETARALDQLGLRGRELGKQQREHEAAIAAAARAHQLRAEDFLALPPLVDVDAARVEAEASYRAAVAADTLGKLARPEPLAALPALDLAALAALLATQSQALGRDVAAAVEAHLAQRLGGTGSAWVREGLNHADGASCPFCAQPVGSAGIIEMYRAWFDRAYDALVARIDAARARVAELEAWWREVQRVGGANVRVFESWARFADVARPPFDSVTRRRQQLELAGGLAAVLEAKRRDAGRPADASALPALETLARELSAAVATYNEAIAAADARIAARLREASGGTLAAAQRRRAAVEAAIERHAPLVVEHVTAIARLDAELAQLKAHREREVARLRADSSARLAAYAARVNRTLAALGADFSIDELGAERSGGVAAARLTLRCERGELEVAGSRAEASLERGLGDGDRTTLALAVFLLELDDIPDLAAHVVVLDDPTASLDELRARRVASAIAALVPRAAQVIVLGHDATVLSQLAQARDAVELALDKELRALVPWRAAAHRERERAAAARQLAAFVRDRTSTLTAAQIAPTLRPLLEAHVRALCPAVFDTAPTLEAAVRTLRKASAANQWTRFSAIELAELERLVTHPEPTRVLAFLEGRTDEPIRLATASG